MYDTTPAGALCMTHTIQPTPLQVHPAGDRYMEEAAGAGASSQLVTFLLKQQWPNHIFGKD